MPDTRPRLLLVDDDRAITSTLTPVLRDLADVDTAHTVAEALERLASHTYNACVLDLVLGDDPAALHDALSSREVPTLLISGRDPAAIGPTAEARGWSYAAKPLAPSVLRGLVAELLGVDAPEPTQRGSRPTPKADASKAAALPVVQVLDKLGDIVAMLVVAYLGIAGKVSGELAVGVVAAIAGVGTGLRTLGGRQVGAASAAVALAAVLTATPTQAHAAPVERPRAHAAPPAATVVALAVLLAFAISGCGGPVLTNPVANVAARIAWPSIHKGAVGAGLCDDDPPEWLVGPSVRKDASAEADASSGAPGDASPPGPSDAGAPAAPSGAQSGGVAPGAASGAPPGAAATQDGGVQ